ncbi:MAG: hypothetical protein PHF80_04330 [Methanothrix sp.]|nr:hypothetical protein [Methanothrix sp.]
MLIWLVGRAGQLVRRGQRPGRRHLACGREADCHAARPMGFKQVRA